MTDLSFSRREAVAALAAATALPMLARSSPALAAIQGGAAGDAEANALLDSIAENLLRQSPEGATSLGIDKGERAILRSQLGDRSIIGQQRLAQTIRADLARANAINTAGLSPFDADQRRGRAQRLCDRARGLPTALWRRSGRKLAEHALRHHPECRRLSGRPAVPRCRASDRDCSRRGSLSCAPELISQAARQ